MTSMLRPALTLFLLLSLLTGLAYPAVVSVAGATLFPARAAGSLVVHDGKAVGSRLVGQPFSSPGLFWGRPSATAPMPYNAAASGGANQAATNPALLEAVRSRVEALRAADPGNTAPIPQDLVTSSASGLDPHISPEAARWQAGRVARARGIDPARVEALIAEHIEPRTLGFLGQPRVNVLALNLALSALQ